MHPAPVSFSEPDSRPKPLTLPFPSNVRERFRVDKICPTYGSIWTSGMTPPMDQKRFRGCDPPTKPSPCNSMNLACDVLIVSDDIWVLQGWVNMVCLSFKFQALMLWTFNLPVNTHFLYRCEDFNFRPFCAFHETTGLYNWALVVF